MRIDDAEPKVLITADAGMRNGKPIPYKHLVDSACATATSPPPHVLIVDRGLDSEMSLTEGRDHIYGELREQHLEADVPCTWLEANEPSYVRST